VKFKCSTVQRFRTIVRLVIAIQSSFLDENHWQFDLSIQTVKVLAGEEYNFQLLVAVAKVHEHSAVVHSSTLNQSQSYWWPAAGFSSSPRFQLLAVASSFSLACLLASTAWCTCRRHRNKVRPLSPCIRPMRVIFKVYSQQSAQHESKRKRERESEKYTHKTQTLQTETKIHKKIK